ncbi:MAG: glycosyltransferase family 39 protein [Bacteroidota bacterium]
MLFLAGFLWKLYFIEERDICLDEPYSIFNAQRSIAEILKIPAEGEPNPPLFMLLLHFWIKLFGIEAFSARFLPLLFNSLTILFLYFTGKRFFSFWTGIVASALFIFSTYHFYHGLEARTYSFFTMATAASLYFYLKYARDDKNRRALIGLILSNVLLVYSHYFGWFVVFSQFLTSFFYIRNFRMLFRFMIPPLATAIGFLPMLPVILKQFEISSRGTWLNPPNANDYMDQLYYFLNHKEVYWVVLYVAAAGLLFSLFLIIKKKWKGLNTGLPVLLVWWLVPYTVMFFVSSKIPMFNSRYVLFNTVGLFLFIGALVNFLYQKNRYLEPVAGLVIIVFMYIHLQVLPKDFALREWKKSIEFVKRYENESSIIVIFPKWTDYMFAYHYDHELFAGHQEFDQNLIKRRIYRVWGQQHAESVLTANPGRRVIYLQDGGINPGEDIFGLLDSVYVRIDHHFYPQTFNIGVYDPKSKSE